MTGPFDLSEITHLMPMPVSSVRLAEMVSDPNSTIKEFVRVVELDQALTADILRWANSAASHPASKITTVKKAVVRLGAANILKLTMGQHLLTSFGTSTPGGELTENELWRHGVAAALCSEALEYYLGRPMPGTAFTAALMHDVGKLLLGRRVGYDALQELVAAAVKEKQLTSIEAERDVLQTDHAEIGGAIARYWHFPDSLTLAIENHHRDNEAGEVLLDVVIVSDEVVNRLDTPTEGATPSERLLTSLRRLGFPLRQLQPLQEKVREEIGRSEALWKAR